MDDVKEEGEADRPSTDSAPKSTGTFWDWIGCEWTEEKDGRVTVSLTVEPRHLNHIGIVHGGVYATLIDSAMGLAVMRSRPDHSVVTTNLNMHYVAPATIGKLTVTAEIVHASRKLVTAQAKAFGEGGALCAFGTGTFRVLEKQGG
ncbi:PaaI family thioesterase [Paenibacillus allorhizosphaerae]|uniref:Thioesterase domain-containing protein n=1 Tax=Paenibacillus allorhizosphaerae TaxID=2849866 RepID=A0ABM8VTR9_9BACL|nr:PaaI family thioesterase [Paenibacillus allorhizosphaerae]CAG7657887.1 hypothetical protein PAECIP111802_06887 [Paenibacillus allorhizosphaerae]